MILDEKQFLFVIGSPRSGTTWLQLMLGAHSAVCTTAELNLYVYTHRWLYHWNQQADNIRQGRWPVGLPMIWTDEDFYGFLREFLDRVYSRVLDTKPEASHILDKHPGNVGFLDEIHMFIPQARFIHIIRDGRDVAASMVAAKSNIGFGTGTIPESAAEWKKHVELARKAKQYDGRYLEIRYEELLKNTEEVMKTIFCFSGLEVKESEVATIVEKHTFDKVKKERLSQVEGVKLSKHFYRKGKAGSWQNDMTPVERYLFDRAAGDLLQELGYAEEGWWAESTGQKYFLPLKAALSTRIPFRQSRQPDAQASSNA